MGVKNGTKSSTKRICKHAIIVPNTNNANSAGRHLKLKTICRTIKPNMDEPSVMTQIKKSGGRPHNARGFFWRKRSSTMSVRITKRYPSICGRSERDCVTSGYNTAAVANPAFEFPEQRVA